MIALIIKLLINLFKGKRMTEKVLYFYKNEVLVSIDGDQVVFPDLKLELSKVYFADYKGRSYYVSEITDTESIPIEYSLEPFFVIYNNVDLEFFRFYGKAMQFNGWYIKTKYCEVCGSELHLKDDETAKICKECGYLRFHNPSPAIIVLVSKGDSILLVKTTYQKYPFFSNVAGYLDTGESLEECVAREVKEEVGLEVEKIKYFESQPFAPSNALMIGFTAQYKSGEIKKDPLEIKDAKWFALDELPQVPGDYSLSGRLISSFIQKHKTK